MVVVRESPRAQHSPDKHAAQWPPKSPFETLLSSPSGRKKWQDRQSRAEERSPSPSPIRKSVTSSRRLQELAGMSEEDEDGDEDEELLRLQLQQIEAKLKLKKLQKAKKAGAEEREGRATGRSERSARGTTPLAVKAEHKPSQRPIEVPLSPVRKSRPLHDHLSPARVKLGLNANFKAQDVSLKRGRDAAQARQAESQQLRAFDKRAVEPERPMSFSERLVQKEAKAEQLEAKREHLESMRSKGFGKDRVEPASAKLRQIAASNDRPAKRSRAGLQPSASAMQLQRPSESRPERTLPRSTSSCNLEADELHSQSAKNPSNAGGRRQAQPRQRRAVSESDDSLEIDTCEGSSGFDPISEIHLSKRHVQHTDIAREMEGKEVYTLPRLLKEVKSPDYEPPDCETDYVVFAILASKSSPFDHTSTHKQTDGHAPDTLKAPTNKFMVLHLCDLKWEIDLFLFGTAFNQFWKLTPGTLLAILNPAIMPPKGSQHSGRFCLKLASSEDAVMEIGVARDLGYCVSVKRDGQPCGTWVDKRKTEACEFHVNLQVEKSRKGRMEVNTMWRGTGPDHKANSRTSKDGAATGRKKGNGTGGTYHREYGQLYSVHTGIKTSAANLLDGEDRHDLSKEEALRKRLAAAQKERDLARELNRMGKGGIGAEYLRTKPSFKALSSGNTHDVDQTRVVKASIEELGLLPNKATDAHLSPAKDRKRHFGSGALPGRSEAMGWGGARKSGLLQPKANRLGSPEKGQTKLPAAASTAVKAGTIRPRSQDSNASSTALGSPQKKRARFALEKGIREPGRESLPGGEEGIGKGRALLLEMDEESDLDIV